MYDGRLCQQCAYNNKNIVVSLRQVGTPDNVHCLYLHNTGNIENHKCTIAGHADDRSVEKKQRVKLDHQATNRPSCT